MSLLNQIRNAFSGYGKSISFINKHKLWSWLIIPGIINLILFLILGVFAWDQSSILTDYVNNQFGVENEIGSSVIFWTILIVSRLIMTLFFILIYKYVLLILVAPALALFSEKINQIQTGQELPFNSKVFINNVFRGVGIAIKNLMKEILLIVLVSLLTFTGILAPFVPVLILVIQSYFYGFSMIDYRCELQGMSIKKSSDFVWENKGIAIGNGVVFNLILLIPFFGVLIAPMLALVAAFLSFDDKKKSLQIIEEI